MKKRVIYAGCPEIILLRFCKKNVSLSRKLVIITTGSISAEILSYHLTEMFDLGGVNNFSPVKKIKDHKMIDLELIGRTLN